MRVVNYRFIYHIVVLLLLPLGKAFVSMSYLSTNPWVPWDYTVLTKLHVSKTSSEENLHQVINVTYFVAVYLRLPLEPLKSFMASLLSLLNKA